MTTDEILKSLERIRDKHLHGYAVYIKPEGYVRSMDKAMERLRTLEAERALLLEVLKAARTIETRAISAGIAGAGKLHDALDACSHIETEK